MDEILEAALLFWLPLAVIPLGVWFSQSKSSTIGARLGIISSLIGLGFVLSSPWTVPDSPSSAVGHLFGFILGPSILMLVGLFKVAYSGNVPVGRLPSSDRNFGAILFALGILWLSLMHWWEITPTLSSGELNPYWLIFLPNFLLSLSSISMAAGLAMIVYGDSRDKESKYLFGMSLFSILFLLCAMNFDSSNIESTEFRKYVWLSIADIIGIAIGSILAIFSFASVIFVYEKSLPKPKSIPAPTEEELSRVSRIIKENIGGEE